MKKTLLLIMFALMNTTWACAQADDQLALKKLVDTFSNLADVKDVSLRWTCSRKMQTYTRKLVSMCQ